MTANAKLLTLRNELANLRHAMAHRPLTSDEFRRMLTLQQMLGEVIL